MEKGKVISLIFIGFVIGFFLGITLYFTFTMRPLLKEIGSPICEEQGLEYDFMSDIYPFDIYCKNMSYKKTIEIRQPFKVIINK